MKIILDEDDKDLEGIVRLHSSRVGCQYLVVRGRKRGSRVAYVHRIVLSRKIGRPLRTGEQADHIDGNKLNNRRSNLRVASHGENQRNRSAPQKNNRSSKYKGVCWDKINGLWLVQLNSNGVHHFGGRFSDEDQAALSYDALALKYHGEFASLNLPEHREGVT